MKLTTCLILVFAVAVQAASWARVRSRRNGETISLNSRIIGGADATRHQFPYMVGMFLDRSGFCGGALISDTIVLTAARCIKRTRNFEVNLAAQSINNYNEVNRQVVETSDALAYATYDEDNHDNDIGYVRLPGPVSGVGIGILRLPAYSQQGDMFVGMTSRLTGWGHVSDLSVNHNPELKYVDLLVMDNAMCSLFYAGLISDSKLCTDSDNGQEGLCVEDYGGPLVVYELDGEPTQIGIASVHSPGGCESGAPSVFIRVTSYLDWIEFNTGITIRP